MTGPARNKLSAEDRLIARHFRPLALYPGAVALSDDAAAYTPPAGCDLVVTADALVAGVHFFPNDPPDAIARKALRVNLSDLAAKGAKPAGFLLSIALPKSADDAWLRRFARGLGADAKTYRCALLGGDTVRTPGPLTISIAAFGTLPKGKIVRRKGARVGDHVFVSGTIGDAALGLALRLDRRLARRVDPRSRKHLLDRYLLPRPRPALAGAVRKHMAASMDVSDGLIGDLTKLCRASGVTAEVQIEAVPLSSAAKAMVALDPAWLETALTGGDDYEILGTVPPRRLKAFRAAVRASGVPVIEIGRIVAGRSMRFVDPRGRRVAFARGSYSHF